MNDQERIEQGIAFRKKMIESFERLAEALKKEVAEYATECSNKIRLEIDIAEIEHVTLPAKKADLEAYMKHSTKKQ